MYNNYDRTCACDMAVMKLYVHTDGNHGVIGSNFTPKSNLRKTISISQVARTRHCQCPRTRAHVTDVILRVHTENTILLNKYVGL